MPTFFSGTAISLSFIGGILLFYSSLYFPLTSWAVAVAILLILAKHKPYLVILLLLMGYLYASHSYIPPRQEDLANQATPQAGEPTADLPDEPQADLSADLPKELPKKLPKELIVGGVFSSIPTLTEKGFRQNFLICACIDAPVSALGKKSIAGKGHSPSAGPSGGPDIGTDGGIDDCIGKNVSLSYQRTSRGLLPGTEGKMKIHVHTVYPRKTPGTYPFDPKLTGYVKHVYELKETHRAQWFFERQRYRLSGYFDTTFTGDVPGLIQSFTIGQTSRVTEHVNETFRTTGLYHLVSISGSHFGMLFLFVMWGVRGIIHRFPHGILNRMAIYLTPSEAAAVVALPILAFYLAISGMSAPAERSFVMIGLFLTGLILGRRGTWLNYLCVSALVIELSDPSAMLTVSFQLSYAAVLFIGLGVDKFLNRGAQKQPDGVGTNLPEEPTQKSTGNNAGNNVNNCADTDAGNKLPLTVRAVAAATWAVHAATAYVKDSVVVSLSASLGTMPAIVYYFHTLSLVQVIANLVVVPYMGFLLMPPLLVGSAIYLVTGWFPCPGVVEWITLIMLKAVDFFAGLPYASINVRACPPAMVIVVYAGILGFFCAKKKWLATLSITSVAILTAIFYVFEPPHPASVVFLDVGQGDSAVVETPSGNALVVDTGTTGKEAAAYLRYRGRSSINALLLSHNDSDHVGGHEYLLRNFKVLHVFDNGRIDYKDNVLKSYGKAIRHLKRGDVATLGGATITTLHPYDDFLPDKKRSSENDYSMVMKLAFSGHSFLFTGDVMKTGEDDLTSLGSLLKADVLKVPHHGSHSSTTGPFLNLVNPAVAVISSGEGNSFGHPHQETLERLRGLHVYRTDRLGTIVLTESPKGLRVKAYGESEIRKSTHTAIEWENLVKAFHTWP
ncbi:MAG: ComEC/Rec2 family competence protein [Nitrospirae bacterium]|nr:ComEC/Rec2 family competence protein [Nitrospirota bacterium]